MGSLVALSSIKEFSRVKDSSGICSVVWDHPKGQLIQALPAEGRNYKLHRCEKAGFGAFADSLGQLTLVVED